MSEQTSQGGWFSIPHALIDRLLPRLRDTELRLVLVVLRQTWGWRKERDWLSHSQLRVRTGRGSAALSRAIAVLIGADLIVVRSRTGDLLDSSAARRREPAGLYFALHPALTVKFLEHHRKDDQNAFSQMSNNNKNPDKASRVVVDELDENGGDEYESSDAQIERGVDRFDAADATLEREGAENKDVLEIQGSAERDADDRGFSDPEIEANWRRVGENLQGNKQEQNGRHP